MNQGVEANNSGKALEDAIEREFHSRGAKVFDYCDQGENGNLFASRFLLKNVPYTSIYGHRSRGEFVYRDFRIDDIRIECRWQQVPGSVDEKLPYMLLNAIHAMPEPEVWVVLEGGGARSGAVSWFRREGAKCETKTIKLLTLPEARMAIQRILAVEAA